MKMVGKFEKQSSPDASPSPHVRETAMHSPWPMSGAVFLKRVKQCLGMGTPGTVESKAPD